jgi:hypothetical protein
MGAHVLLPLAVNSKSEQNSLPPLGLKPATLNSTCITGEKTDNKKKEKKKMCFWQLDETGYRLKTKNYLEHIVESNIRVTLEKKAYRYHLPMYTYILPS